MIAFLLLGLLLADRVLSQEGLALAGFTYRGCFEITVTAEHSCATPQECQEFCSGKYFPLSVVVFDGCVCLGDIDVDTQVDDAMCDNFCGGSFEKGNCGSGDGSYGNIYECPPTIATTSPEIAKTSCTSTAPIFQTASTAETTSCSTTHTVPPLVTPISTTEGEENTPESSSPGGGSESGGYSQGAGEGYGESGTPVTSSPGQTRTSVHPVGPTSEMTLSAFTSTAEPTPQSTTVSSNSAGAPQLNTAALAVFLAVVVLAVQ